MALLSSTSRTRIYEGFRDVDQFTIIWQQPYRQNHSTIIHTTTLLKHGDAAKSTDRKLGF